jgi:hypothetical protein
MLLSVSFGTTCFVVIVTSLVVYWLIQKWKYKYPPGPPALPLIGNLLRKQMLFKLFKYVIVYQVYSYDLFLLGPLS